MTLTRAALVLVALLAALAGLAAAFNFRGEDRIPDAPPAFTPTAEQVKRGEYLARAGNCVTCHTVRGGAAYSGGLGVNTPF